MTTAIIVVVVCLVEFPIPCRTWSYVPGWPNTGLDGTGYRQCEMVGCLRSLSGRSALHRSYVGEAVSPHRAPSARGILAFQSRLMLQAQAIQWSLPLFCATAHCQCHVVGEQQRVRCARKDPPNRSSVVFVCSLPDRHAQHRQNTRHHA